MARALLISLEYLSYAFSKWTFVQYASIHAVLALKKNAFDFPI
jgi:hypothetical protein